MEILEIRKKQRSVVKITENERKLILDCLEMRKSKAGREESREIDRLKYGVIDQNERIRISKSEANAIREILHDVGAFSKEINDLIHLLQRLSLIHI